MININSIKKLSKNYDLVMADPGKFNLTKIIGAANLILFFIASSLSFSAERIDPADSLRNYNVPSITVTTTRAEQGISPVPVSEMTKQDLQNLYITQDIPQLLSDLPSVYFYSQNGNGIGYSSMTMRGFDQRRISVYVNGIPQNDPEDHNVYWIDFPDIASNLDNIQVQRGAGLSNYGGAAIGGSVNLTTSNFVAQKGIKLYSGIGYQQYGAGGNNVIQPVTTKNSIEVSSGLTGSYAVYARLSNINSDGYRDRSWTNMNSYFISGARFDDNLTTQINFFGGPFSDGLAYYGVPKSYIKDLSLRRKNLGFWTYDSTGSTVGYSMDRRKQEVEAFSQPHYEMLNDWTINDKFTFKSALFYYSGSGYYDFDGSWGDATTFRMTKQYGFDSVVNPTNAIIRAWVENKQGGWIPRLIYKNGDNEMTLGAEIRFHRSLHWGKIQYAENLPPNFDTDYQIYSYNGKRDAFSLFAREIYNMSEKLVLSAELQYTYQLYGIYGEKAGNINTVYQTTSGGTAGNGGDLFNVGYNFLNPRIGATYKIDNSNSLFGMAAITSREPRMANLYMADNSYGGSLPSFEADTLPNGTKRFNFSKPLIKPETMYDLELGWNYIADRVNCSANIYFMEYRNELVQSGRLDMFGNAMDDNAHQSRHTGLELGGAYIILESGSSKLNISANATISSNKIIQYDYIIDTGEKISLNNNTIAGFPSSMFAVRLNYFYSGLFVSIGCKSLGSFRSDNFGDLLKTDQRLIAYLNRQAYSTGYWADNKVDGYTVFNLDFSYTFKDILSMRHLKIQGQILNLTNLIYAAGAEGKDFFPGAERSFFLGLELGI